MANLFKLARYSSSSPTAIDAQLNTWLTSNAYQVVDVDYRIDGKGDRVAMLTVDNGTAKTSAAKEFQSNSSNPNQPRIADQVNQWLVQYDDLASGSTITIEKVAYDTDGKGNEWALILYDTDTNSNNYQAYSYGPDYNPVGQKVVDLFAGITLGTAANVFVKHAFDGLGRSKVFAIVNV